MAISIGSDSNVISGQTEALQLSHDIVQHSSFIGKLTEQEKAAFQILDAQASNISDVCDTVSKVASRANKMVEKVSEIELSLASKPLSSVDGFARRLLTTQFEAFKGLVDERRQKSINNSYFMIHYANVKLHKLFPSFEKSAVQYLQSRQYSDLNAAQRILRDLVHIEYSVTDLTENRGALIGEKVEDLDRVHQWEQEFQSRLEPRQDDESNDASVKTHCSVLAKLIGEGGYGLSVRRYEGLLTYLDEMSMSWDADTRERVINNETGTRNSIDETIERLHQEVGSDQVNYWVWKLSGEKPGENYGQVHRYDDLGILHEAVLRTMKSLADKIMKEEAAGLEPEAVYAKLFEIIGEPQVENPSIWMHENICYYTDELREAIEQVKFPERQFNVIDPVAPSDMIFAAPAPALDLSELDSVPALVAPQKHAYTQVLTELSAVGESSISSELRERIEVMISELSEKGQANTINYEVWRIGGEKSGENWGVAHRYDDPAVLSQALMIAVRYDVHNEMAKTFSDVEDLNAFYAQITAIVFGDSGIPSDVDLVAYGKENIPFHLHQIERAKDAVLGLKAQMA